ncbi:MAG: DUF1963 domain-containing protein [Candidatus Cryptobacteroides sp.]
MAIRLALSKTEKPLFCESKWWGDPDMPADMEYPMMKVDGENDYPLTFVCQIRCEDIAGLDRENLLPHDGMLYFFAAVDEYAGYDSPVHLGIGEWPKGSVTVKYTKSINMETFQSCIMVDDDEQPVTDPALEISFSECGDLDDGIKLLGRPFFEEIREQYPDRVSLLQIDGDEVADIRFYDEGMLNLLVTETDIKKGILKRPTAYMHSL